MKSKIFTLVTLMFILISSFSFAQTDLEIAKQLVKEKKFSEAKDILENIIDKDDTNAEAYYVLGKVFMSLKEFDDAEDNFEEAIDLDKKNSDYHLWLGRAYGLDARESSIISQAFLAPKIKTQFLLAVQYDTTNIEARIALAQYYLQAPGIMGGDVDKAFEQGKIILKDDEANGRLILANVFSKKELPDSAENQFRLLLDKYGNDKKYAGIYNSYGYMLLNRKKYDEAIEAFKKQVEFLPDKANSYDSLGDGYRKAGKLELALEQYKKAVQIDPTFEPSKKNIEEVEEELQNQNK